MSSEQTKTPKESGVKKWLRRLRGGSPSPAALASAPSTPQSIASTGSVPPSSTASLAAQHTESEATSQSGVSTGNNETPGPSGLDVAKDYLSVTGSFLQLVLKKLPDAVDSNPVKVAFSLAKAVLELKEGMDDNANNVKKRIFATSELLLTVETALERLRIATRWLHSHPRAILPLRRPSGWLLCSLSTAREYLKISMYIFATYPLAMLSSILQSQITFEEDVLGLFVDRDLPILAFAG
ncbi:hypothetical protein BKA70DRAFT_209215 [Coprinopsis sp. MPI-PUGE-AT-0042]|nr:hypothetical protein BKA70DRAFT_209215 [Coprinopsis sp. MPI-PUGE-AT-0042]